MSQLPVTWQCTEAQPDQADLLSSDISTGFFSLSFQINQHTTKIILKYGKISIGVMCKSINYVNRLSRALFNISCPLAPFIAQNAGVSVQFFIF